jgi:hypothetical protein
LAANRPPRRERQRHKAESGEFNEINVLASKIHRFFIDINDLLSVTFYTEMTRTPTGYRATSTRSPDPSSSGGHSAGVAPAAILRHPADQIVLREYVDAVRTGKERLLRIEGAITKFLANWQLAPFVDALQELRVSTS